MDFSLRVNINQDSHQLLLKGMKQNVLDFVFEFFSPLLYIKGM